MGNMPTYGLMFSVFISLKEFQDTYVNRMTYSSSNNCLYYLDILLNYQFSQSLIY